MNPDPLVASLVGGLPTPGAVAEAGAAPIDVIVALTVLLLGAKLGEEVFRRVGQPAVVGELVGGFLVGPHALGLVTPGETVAVFAEIGVVILLFGVGLEVRVDDLLRVGRPALLTGVIGMLLPIAFGLAIGIAFGEPLGTASFIGLVLAATSIGITSRVLAQAGVLDRAFARVVLGAAVIDDILALVAISVVTAFSSGTAVDRAVVVGISAVGLVLLGLAAARRTRGLPRDVFTWPLFADTPLVPAFLLMLGAALVSAMAGLAALIGAFIAGLVIAETEAREELEHEIRPLGQIFTPFFFGATGMSIDLSVLGDPTVIALAATLTIAGIATKVAGGVLGARALGRWPARAVGIGMIPRGEVGIVVANLGLAAGILTGGTFGGVIVAVVATTMVAPYLLAWVIPRAVGAPD